MMQQYDYKKGFSAIAVCYLIWGLQPLYFALNSELDTLFLMACRIVWAGLFCLLLLKLQGKMDQLIAVFRSREILKREIPAAFLLLADWTVYLLAVRNGKVMQCAMGYYIMPLVMFVFGAVVFREKISWKHFVVLAFVLAGIICSAEGFGEFPTVTVLLALCFAVYSAIKKSLEVDSIVSTTAEIVMLVPLAILYILLFRRGENGLQSLQLPSFFFTLGSGIVTALPMLFFSVGVKKLPLTLTGLMQYVAPTLALVCSHILGESFSERKILSFALIWVGILLYVGFVFAENKKKSK